MLRHLHQLAVADLRPELAHALEVRCRGLAQYRGPGGDQARDDLRVDRPRDARYHEFGVLLAHELIGRQVHSGPPTLAYRLDRLGAPDGGAYQGQPFR